MSSQIFGDRSLKKVNESHAILQDETDFRSGSVINIRDPLPKRKAQSSWQSTGVIILIVLITIGLYLFLVKSGLLKRGIIAGEEWLKSQWQIRPLAVILIIYLTIQFLMVFCLGFKMIVFVVAALVIQNNWVTYPLLLFSSISGDFYVFLICTFWLRSYIIRKFKDNDFFIVLLEESKSEPYKTAFVTRLLFIPNGFKNYILMAIDNSPQSYFFSGAVFHSVFTAQALIITTEFQQIEEFFTTQNSWEQKTPTQKWTFIGFICILGLTLGLALFLGLWARRKIDQKRKARTELVVKDYELN